MATGLVGAIMKYIQLGVALLIVGLATTIEIDGANASSSYSTETTREAYAVFQLQSGGLSRSAEINVQEWERTSSEGSERGIHSDIELTQNDSRGNRDRMINVAGSVDIQTGAFALRDDVAGGTIDVVIPVCGAKPGHDGRLKQRSFNDCFDVQVSLAWTGTGDVYSFSGEDDYPGGSCIIHTTSGYQRRTASASGTVLVGDANLAASNSVSSAMSSYTGTTTATCPD
jgi:hypothetical protein